MATESKLQISSLLNGSIIKLSRGRKNAQRSQDNVEQFVRKAKIGQWAVVFFWGGVLGLSRPWLFNTPPAKTKDSKLQISSLLNGSKAKLSRRRKNAQRSQDNVEQYVRKSKIEQWAVFFFWVLGLSRPWLFNTPPAKTKDSKLQISSLLIALPGNGCFARFQKHNWRQSSEVW